MNKKEVQHIPVLGDGDCLFHSITNYLHIDKNRKKHKGKSYSYSLNELSNQQWSKLSMNLRRKVVRWLRDNLDYEMPTGLTIRDEINEDFPGVDTSIIIGANDIVNPSALDDPNSPIAGMPVLECWKGKTSIVLKRTMATGYAGIQNPLFFKDNTRMLFGDAKASMDSVLTALESS